MDESEVGGGPPDPFAKMKEFMVGQFENTNGKIEKMNSTMTKINDKVGINARNLSRLKKTVEENADSSASEIIKMQEVMKENEQKRDGEIALLKHELSSIRNGGAAAEGHKEIEKIKLDIANIRTNLDDNSPGTTSRGADRTVPPREEEYWLARRSLRLWPVKGQGADELAENAASFINGIMRVPESTAGRRDIVSVQRVATRMRKGGTLRPNIVKDEVTVKFTNISVRDFVASYAFNLGSFADDEGMPTAGVRLEIPPHLVGLFQDFQGYGGFLKKQHGRGFKRSVKFEDKDMTLTMDIKLPGSDEWLLVDHSMAAENRRERANKRVAFARDRLTSSQSSNPSDGENARPIIGDQRNMDLPTSDILSARKKRRNNPEWE